MRVTVGLHCYRQDTPNSLYDTLIFLNNDDDDDDDNNNNNNNNTTPQNVYGAFYKQSSSVLVQHVTNVLVPHNSMCKVSGCVCAIPSRSSLW